MTVVAIIGCGRISDMAHFPALSEMEDVRIKYACDLVLEKAEAKKEKYPKIENVVTDYKVCLADEEVDAVFVLTPNYSHYTITMDALKAGQHVLCEKPITINYQLSVEMAEEAKKQGKILDIGVCNRYNRSIEMLRQWAEEGKFGKLYHVYASFRACRCIPGLGGPFTTKAQSGGGVLIDWGVHFLDLILYVLGGAKVSSVTCDAYNEIAKDMPSYVYNDMWAKETADIENGTNDVEDFIAGHIRTDKASISFNGAWAQNVNKHELFIDFMGDKGGARLRYGDKFEFFDGSTLESFVPDYDMPNMYSSQDTAFLKSIATGEKDRNNIEYVLETMKLLDTLYVSADKKEEIKL